MCPRCHEPLIVVEFQGVEVDHCLECQGTWLDAGELEFLLELAGGDAERVGAALRAAPKARAPDRRCPRCRARMDRVRVGEPAIEIDVCRAGEGIWLDKGELAAVVRAYAQRPDEAGVAEFFGEMFRHELTGKTEEN